MKRILFALLLLSVACNSPKAEDTAALPVKKTPVQHAHAPAKAKKQADEKPVDEETLKNEARLIPHEKTLEGLTFRYGYTEYDEDVFGFENPGYLEVKKDGKLLFKDAFKGEGEPFVTSLGYHDLGGDKKLIFKLNYGTEACDYTQTSRYYVLNNDGSISYISEYWSAKSGDGYSNRHFKEIWPGDVAGQSNTLTIVEGIDFNDNSRPNQYDTARILFNGNAFKVQKLSDNLNRAAQ